MQRSLRETVSSSSQAKQTYLDDFGSLKIQTRLGTARGLVLTVVGGVTRHLTNGAWAAPERAAAIFAAAASLLRNRILVANVGARSERNHQDKQAVRDTERLTNGIKNNGPKRNVLGRVVYARFVIVAADKGQRDVV